MENARVLDRQRLGKQRVESLQIITALHANKFGYKYGWQSHPAVKMWAGSELALCVYSLAICTEWIERGYQDTCKEKIKKLMHDFEKLDPTNTEVRPWWWGDSRVHNSHKSNLLFKFPKHYSQFGWKIESGLPYFWPV